MHERHRKRLLAFWADYVASRPRLVIILAVLTAASALVITILGVHWGPIHFDRLRFQSDRNDLLSSQLDWNKDFIDWRTHFPGHDDLIVVVDTHTAQGQPDPDARRQAEAFIAELASQLKRDDEMIAEVLWGFSAAEVDPRAILIQRLPAFEQQLDQLSQSRLMLLSAAPQQLLANIMTQAGVQMRHAASSSPESESESASSQQQGGAVLGQFQQLIDDFARDLRAEESDETSIFASYDWIHLTSDNGRLLFARISPKRGDSIIAADGAVTLVRDRMTALRSQYPQVQAGLTGIEVVEADETRIAVRDSTRASILAVVLIAGVLIAAFHSWRAPLLAMIALLLGIAWTFGFLTLAVGHLQVLSVVFTVILLGLGVDFGVHLTACYETVRHDFADNGAGFADAMRATFQRIGPGLMTGAITTAAAFGVLWLANRRRFDGAAELGLIAAGGIGLCLLAMMTVFPALLRIYKRRHRHLIPLANRRFHFFEERWVMPFAAHPMRTMVWVLIVTLLAGWGAVRTLSNFDYNLLNLLPKDVESIVWQKRAEHDGEQSLWYSVCIVESADDPNDPLALARRRAEQFRQLPLVAEVGGVGVLFPQDLELKLRLLRELRLELTQPLQAALADDPKRIDAARISDVQSDLFDQLQAVAALLTQFQPMMPQSIEPQAAALQQSLIKLTTWGRALPPEDRARRVQRLTQHYRVRRFELANLIDRAVNDPNLIAADEMDESTRRKQLLSTQVLPEFVRRRYQSDDGRYVLEIHPKLTDDVSDPLDPSFLPGFIKQVQSVDDHVTGSTVQIHKSGQLIWTSFRNAGWFALAAVLLLVLLDFQRLGDALLALTPVVIGFIWLGGLMWLIGQRINPANIMVLPLLFGIGVDAGVHVLHRYRSDPHTRPLGLTGGVGKGVTITSLTTMIGFASMIPASHRGIQGLGVVLTLGVLLTLLACWIVLPAWLELRERHRGNGCPPSLKKG